LPESDLGTSHISRSLLTINVRMVADILWAFLCPHYTASHLRNSKGLGPIITPAFVGETRKTTKHLSIIAVPVKTLTQNLTNTSPAHWVLWLLGAVRVTLSLVKGFQYNQLQFLRWEASQEMTYRLFFFSCDVKKTYKGKNKRETERFVSQRVAPGTCHCQQQIPVVRRSAIDLFQTKASPSFPHSLSEM
jgi:hypothetical protein